MNRHERRQRKLGRVPTVVALPTPNRSPRIRRVTETLKKACNMVTIDAGKMSDSPFVVKLMQDHFVKTGNMPVVLDPSAPMLIARHKISGEPLGFISVKTVPPGKIYIENLHVVPGAHGKMAARALAERLMQIPAGKVCMIEAGNAAMLRVLEHYGGRVTGFLVEGPFTDAPVGDRVDPTGAPEESVAAEPVEMTV